MSEMPLQHIIDCYTDFQGRRLKGPKVCVKQGAPDKCLVRSVWHRYSRRGPATLPVNHTRSCRSKPRIALSSYAKNAGQNQQTTCGGLTTPGKKWTTLSVSANFKGPANKVYQPRTSASRKKHDCAGTSCADGRYAARFQ